MKLKILFIVLLGVCCNQVMAQRKKDKQPIAKVDSVKKDPLSTIITKNTETKKGLFNIYRTGDKYYFEIPDSILKRELLLTTFLVKTPGGSPKFGGEQMNEKVMSFDKGLGNKINLRIITLMTKSDSSNAIAKAVANSNIDPIAIVFDIKAKGNGGKSSIIDVTDFLQKENSFTMLSPEVAKRLNLGAMASDRSYVKSFASYPVNVEIKMVRTYAATAPAKVDRYTVALEAAKVGGAATMEISTSILLMPEKPMVGRQFDLRVGYFADNSGYIPLSDDQQNIKDKTFIVRYRLEPKAEDMERYKRGELVEPKQQIVYYIDPATPKQWRKYLIAGINDWNVAFEAAGFKNAIIGKEWPENDTTMSLEDARYKVLRYLPSDTPNAYGPNIHDPRSGEILQGYIGWYHNVMTLVHDWYMIQAGPNDPRARSMKFDEELMGELIRFVSSHEVGHTLGLRHNMGSSSLTPVEKLRDKEWVEKHGHCNSIMDYARFNYVAQPEDNIGPKGIYARIGDYDKWAIKWGYTYTGAKDDDEDKKIVSQWIVDSLKANPGLWFGGEGRNHDARCQTEDLGDNSMKANEYGIKNLKHVVAHLPEWTKEEGDLYKNLAQMYIQVVTQFNRYATHVSSNVASVYETFKYPGDAGEVYASAPVEKQKEAVAWLNKYVFETPTWLLDQNILNKIGAPIHLSSVRNIQERQMAVLLSDRVFNTMNLMQQRFGEANTYSMNEYLSDLKQGVFSELKTNKPIDQFRRDVQKSYVTGIIRAMKEGEIGNNAIGLLFSPGAAEETPLTTNTDISALLAVHLENLRKDILAAIPATTDKDSKEHLQYVADNIKRALNKRFDTK
ncbi:zinc-dependent metalloprotease [Solitalea lacus]|uniref:zinc-dependent metalloprotease n=1 Tax=Solitalea lacus TaxID=2911172 RepID=UPI001EDA7EE4|nr:zinc-dependent metalloprotease [Solitalea lacus]UKJ09278.1 zinc-dependent metalloprotease [Solitalea lacus]